MTATLETPRLILRQWIPSDLPYFAKLNADAETMRFFPEPLSKTQSDAIAKRCADLIVENGWGFWAVELKDPLTLQNSEQFIGMVGLHQANPALPFSPCVEIGWRLLKQHWGRGYANEAARAALAFGFNELQLEEIVAFTAKVNTPSQALMQKLGMQNTQQNFLHPDLDPEHPLAEHVLYRLNRKQWCNLKDIIAS